MKLYKRNAQGKPIVWEIVKIAKQTGVGIREEKLIVRTGLVGGNLHEETIDITKTKVDEIESRIKAKRKEGYKELSEIKDNFNNETCNVIETKSLSDSFYKSTLLDILNTYLPKYSTTSEGFVLPMLAKTLVDNKPFEKFGTMLGQWKINGLRCLIGAERNGNDLFTPIILTYHSREGEDWTNKMRWFDEILLPKITQELLDMMIEECAYLDGELYLPGYSVNDINSFVKNAQLPQHYQLQYWCYDIACENLSAGERTTIRFSNIKHNLFLPQSKEQHLNNKDQLILLINCSIRNIAESIEQRNYFIDLGFEGLILRNPNAEYQFGKRNQSMFKFKKIDDGLFKIFDIKEDKRGLPIFILKNDINDEYFECTYNASQDDQRKCLSTPVKEEMLTNKLAFVEFRERSGVKQVPFHAKIIRFEKKQ